VAPHRRAEDVKKATGHFKQGTHQSAHMGATGLLKSLPGYSRNDALTQHMDPATHRSFDSKWLDWVRNERKVRPSPTATLSEALTAQRDALQQTTGLTQNQKNTLYMIMEREYADLSLNLPHGMSTRIPLPDLK
jgi:hypothetical protein